MKTVYTSEENLVRRILPLLLVAATDVIASEPKLEWHGFLTTAVTMTDVDYPYSYGSSVQPDYAKYSKLGLNVSRDLSPEVAVAAQLLAERESLELEWAFARLRFTDWLSLQAGRQKFPVWLYSDRISVGQAYNWVTPPEEVYGQNPIKKIDGLSITATPEIGPLETNLEIFGGTFTEVIETVTSDRRKIEITGSSKSVFGGSFQIGTEWMTLRSGAARAKVHVASDLYEIEDAEANFWSQGLILTQGPFEFVAEYASLEFKADKDQGRRSQEAADAASQQAASSGSAYDRLIAQKASLNALANNSSYLGGKTGYVMVAWTAGKFTPHLTYAELEAPDDAFIYGDQKSWTTGIKYSVNLATDMKLQWQKVDIAQDSWGLYARDYADPTHEYEDLNVYSASLDYVF